MEALYFRYILFLVSLMLVDVGGVKITMLLLFGKSHYMTTRAIGEEMVRRGHQVTLCLPGAKSTAGSLTTEESSLRILNFYQGFEQEDIAKIFAQLGDDNTKSVFNQMRVYHESHKFFAKTCSSIMSDPLVVKSIQEADMLVSEIPLLCSGLIAKQFQKKWVALAPSAEPELISYLHRVYLNPSHFASFLTGFSEDMTFLQRVQNFLMHQMVIYLYPGFIKYSFNDFLVQHGKPGVDMVEELGKAEIILGNCDFAFHYPYPQMPNEVCVGPFLAKKVKPLPPELETYLNESPNGAVLVAFGSLKEDLTKNQVKVMAAALGRLQERVIWKLRETHGLEIQPNIRFMEWLPQNDLLGHPKLKLFVSHVGQSSVQEAGYHGVPVLAVPFGGDQFANADFVSKRMKMGLSIDITTAGEEEWFGKIQDILTNSSYKRNARRISRLLRTKKFTALESAGDLIQYVIDNDYDVSHWKSRGPDLPWHVVNLWDVYLLLFFITFMILLVICSVAKMITRCCRGVKTKKD